MQNNPLEKNVNKWLQGDYPQEVKTQILQLKEKNPEEFADAFYKELEFGTGGLRGIMGIGPNRMNKYTIGAATQAIANYLHQLYPSERIKIAIAYDSRNNSRYFSEIASQILSANKIHCYLFEDLRPLPELSFTVRHLQCQAGIMITASHNPKEYNGYKVFWNDGAQLVPPHDKNILTEIRKIKTNSEINWEGNNEYIQLIGEKIDEIYLNKIKSLSLNPDSILKQANLPIIYSPLHGTGITLIPKALKMFGFNNLRIVHEQATPDGNFPTVLSPNPEEKLTMSMALQQGEEQGCCLVLATDPDTDRMGVAVRNDENKLELLNGNMVATLLIYYLLQEWKNHNKLNGNQFIAKTIVTTDIILEIAKDFKVECENVLTGFKYIAEKISENENKKQFIIGGEESYGMLVGDFVRDKDAVSACCLMAELTAHLKNQNTTPFELLKELYVKYGFYKESLFSITKKGKSGAEAIQNKMLELRNTPPKSIANSKITTIHDYLTQCSYDVKNNKTQKISLPKSNVLQFITEDNSKITIRPSGTEPKIKIYMAVKGELRSKKDFALINQQLTQKIKTIEDFLRDLVNTES